MQKKPTCHSELSRALRADKTGDDNPGDFRAVVTLNGRLEARRYKGARFFVAASSQLAMIAFRLSMEAAIALL